jgi:hypothetical protein
MKHWREIVRTHKQIHRQKLQNNDLFSKKNILILDMLLKNIPLRILKKVQNHGTL